MSSYLTSETLIDSVKRKAHIPESQVTFSDDDFLAFANEEILLGLVPSIIKMHEEFYVYPKIIPLVSNQSDYEIPDRAIGTKIRTMFYRDTSTNLRELARINPDDEAFYQNVSNLNAPNVFFLENNSIKLIPRISSSPGGSLVVKILQRPNQLVLVDRIATIQSIDTNTGDIVVDSVPSVFSTSSLYDFLETSRGHVCRAIDVAIVTINSTTKTLNFAPSSIPSTLLVGDQIALAGECNIPQMPDDLHSVLAQRVVCRCLEAQKDLEGLQAANAKLQEMEMSLGILIDNRTEGQPQKVNNLRGALRAGKFRHRRSTY